MTAVTELNDFFHERDKQRPLADVLTDFRQSHQVLLAALEPLAYADLLKARHPDDQNSELLLQTVGSDTYEHYQEHRMIIQKIID